jgi:hypothetical protein
MFNGNAEPFTLAALLVNKEPGSIVLKKFSLGWSGQAVWSGSHYSCLFIHAQRGWAGLFMTSFPSLNPALHPPFLGLLASLKCSCGRRDGGPSGLIVPGAEMEEPETRNGKRSLPGQSVCPCFPGNRACLGFWAPCHGDV